MYSYVVSPGCDSNAQWPCLHVQTQNFFFFYFLFFFFLGFSGVTEMVLDFSLTLFPVQYVLHLCPHTFHLVSFSGTGPPIIILSTCPPYHFRLSFVVFVATGATLTDLVTCSLLVLSIFVTPHIHHIIIMSFTSSLLSSLFVVAYASAPYTNAGLTTVLIQNCCCQMLVVETLKQTKQLRNKVITRWRVPCNFSRNM